MGEVSNTDKELMILNQMKSGKVSDDELNKMIANAQKEKGCCFYDSCFAKPSTQEGAEGAFNEQGS